MESWLGRVRLLDLPHSTVDGVILKGPYYGDTAAKGSIMLEHAEAEHAQVRLNRPVVSDPGEAFTEVLNDLEVKGLAVLSKLLYIVPLSIWVSKDNCFGLGGNL